MVGDSLELLRKRAKEALSRGDYAEARRIYERAVIFRGDNVELHYGLATVCFVLNDLDSAVQHFQEVIRLDPMRANAHINLGAVYDRMGNYDESLVALQRGIHLDPSRSEGYYNLALVYKHFGELDKAVEAYHDAIRNNPRMYEAYYNLGNIFLEKHQYREAIKEYRRALEIRPNCDKAKSALVATLEAQRDLHGEVAVSEETAPEAEAPVDLNRLIDPNVHVNWLREMHNAVIEINSSSSTMLDFLRSAVEEAIREMSICILATKDPKHDIEAQIQKFDEVRVKLKQQNDALHKRMAHTKTLCQALVKA